MVGSGALWSRWFQRQCALQGGAAPSDKVATMVMLGSGVAQWLVAASSRRACMCHLWRLEEWLGLGVAERRRVDCSVAMEA
jgi:hypothetical protein